MPRRACRTNRLARSPISLRTRRLLDVRGCGFGEPFLHTRPSIEHLTAEMRAGRPHAEYFPTVDRARVADLEGPSFTSRTVMVRICLLMSFCRNYWAKAMSWRSI
jgi:hypothetical protein